MQTVHTGMPVSRAENKLAGAAQAFSYDFRGKTVLDIGSSTGGFTEYALLRGAKRVIAVEKGTKQMKAPLRFDPRIDLREKTDIFSVTRSSLSRDQDESNENESKTDVKIDTILKINTILADVSFISLKQVLLHAKKQLATPQTDFLVMLKPQFEARPFQLKNGVVKNETIRRDIIKDFEAWLKNNGFLIVNKRDNTLAGKNGNLERFYFLKLAVMSHKNR
jgi:ftsJ-like methyltransferase